jgi:hypothetical protein
MKIVQSFWSGRKSLLENNFGWRTPQHHVMGWALSCLRLKEHYKDVHLYTDTAGYEILIGYLHLPYKEVHVCYDELHHYPRTLWAVPKILTYAAQKEPFIHVDGDVFTWKRFNPELEKAQLIAQNEETGTSYYAGMMGSVKKDLSYLPECLETALAKDSIPSYNAGILGGSDLDFFARYTDAALNLVRRNYGGDVQAMPSINFNILFEQILFYALAEQEDKKVSCFFADKIMDNGYKQKSLADFSSVPHQIDYLHLIGRNKFNKGNCELMARVLFKEYPDYFYRIMTLFRNDHARYERNIRKLCPQPPDSGLEGKAGRTETGFYRTRQMVYGDTAGQLSGDQEGQLCGDQEGQRSDDREDQPSRDREGQLSGGDGNILQLVQASDSLLVKDAFQYEQQLARHIRRWEEIGGDHLYVLESACVEKTGFFLQPKEEQLVMSIERNPHIEVIEASFDWTDDLRTLVEQQVKGETKTGGTMIACVPRLFFDGYIEMSIDDLSYNILALLDTPLPLQTLLNELQVCFKEKDVQENQATIYDLVLLKIKHLFYSQLVSIGPASGNN